MVGGIVLRPYVPHGTKKIGNRTAMVSLTEQPWFIGLVAGLAALILVLLCIIVVFCTLWARKDRIRKRENRLRRLSSRLEQDQIIMGMNASNTLPLGSPNNNSNWFLKERPPEEMRASTLTRAAGNEPFVVGRSLSRYSRELDGSRSSTGNRYIRSYSDSEWKRASMPVLSPYRPEPPNVAEERMVRLGMIAPRTHEATGQYPMGYMTAPHPARGKDGKRKSSGNVLMPVRESDVWEMENNPQPSQFAFPKEDYNTNGAAWYRSKSLDGHNLMSPQYNYPRHGPQVHPSQTPSRKISTGVSPGHSPTGVPSTITEEQEPEKLKRIQRVGVPILPD